MAVSDRSVQERGIGEAEGGEHEPQQDALQGAPHQVVSHILNTYGITDVQIARGMRETGLVDDAGVWLALQKYVGLSHVRRVRAQLQQGEPGIDHPIVTAPVEPTSRTPAPQTGQPGQTGQSEQVLPEPEQEPVEQEEPSAEDRSPGGVALIDREVTYLGVKVVAQAGTHLNVIARCQQIIGQLLGNNRRAQERLADEETTIVIIPSNVAMTSLPQFRRLRGQRTFDGRDWSTVRGSGGMQTRDGHMIGVAEETLVDVDPRRLLPGIGTYGPGFSLGMHELAHTLHHEGLSRRQRREVDRLYQARNSADPGNRNGTWSDTYASTGVDEYFAQATNVYFGTNAMANNHNGRDWLRANDPAMYAFLSRLYEGPRTMWAAGPDGQQDEVG